MQPKVELTQVRDLDETINDSFLFFKQNWKPLVMAYFAICGFFLVAGLASSLLNQFIPNAVTEKTGGVFTLYYFLGVIFSLVGQILVQLVTLSYIVIYKENGNQPVSLADVWGYVKFHFFRIFFSSLLCGLMVVIGAVCCIIPGIYLFPVCSLMIAIMVLENTTFGYAFDRAFVLMKNNWWQVFGVMFLVTLVIGIISMAVIIPAMLITGVYTFVTGVSFATVFQIPLVIASHLVQVVYIIPAIAVALCYYSLTEQKEGTSLLARIEMFGKRDTTSPDMATEEY